MLFNSGTTSLVSQTRLYADDSGSSARPRWTDAQVKAQANLAYERMLEMARQMGVGWSEQISYVNSVADQKNYTLPTGTQRIKAAWLSGNGSNLSTADPASSDIITLKPVEADVAWAAYHAQPSGGPTTIHIEIDGSAKEFYILPPPSSTEAGTNSIKLLVEAEATALSGDTSEPIFAEVHHDTIALWAAINLLRTKNLPIAELERELNARIGLFRRDTHLMLYDPEGQASAGLEAPTKRDIQAGKVIYV